MRIGSGRSPAISRSAVSIGTPQSSDSAATVSSNFLSLAKSVNPQEAPAINPNYLDHEVDRAAIIAGLKLSRQILHAQVFNGSGGAEIYPGKDVQTDDEWLDYAYRHGSTVYHPVGTCKMGTDRQAVVDPELRVHGVAGLRVVDASVFPKMTSSNTNAPTLMIAEKAADMILAEANLAA